MATVTIDEQTLKEMSALLASVRDSVTPHLAERITTLLGNLGQVAGEVDPQVAQPMLRTLQDEAPAIMSAMKQLGEWQKTGAWNALVEMVSVVAAIKDSATPGIAERITTLAGNLGQVGGEVDPQVAQPMLRTLQDEAPAIMSAMKQLGEWQKTGAWNSLVEMVSVVAAIKDSATPGIAERITTLVGNLGQVGGEVDPQVAQPMLRTLQDEAPSIMSAMKQLGEWQKTGAWNSLVEMVSVVAAIKDSATPGIAERMATLFGQLGQVADQTGPGLVKAVAAVEDEGESLAQLVQDIARWQKDGTWDAVQELVSLAKGLLESVTPNMSERVMGFASDAVLELRAALDSGLLGLGIRAMDMVHEASVEAQHDTSKISATGLLRQLKDPSVQAGMKLILAMLRRMPSLIQE